MCVCHQVDTDLNQPELFAETSLSTGKCFSTDDNSMSFANPMYDPDANFPTYKVEDVMVHIETSNSFKIRKPTIFKMWDKVKSKRDHQY